MTTQLDDVNRRVWGSPELVEQFLRRRGSIDAGEAVVLERAAPAASGRAILDLGFGGGRTIALLREISDAYVGLDYVPELVEAARAAHPGTRLEQGDARDLSRFDDRSFALVVFSFNGIDGLEHDDRLVVLREVARVLEPGGAFVYSTHNLDHPAAGGIATVALRVGLRRPWGLLRRLPRVPRALVSRRRLRRLSASGEGWSIHPDPAYGYAMVLHHATLAEALAEAAAAGLERIEVYASDGRRVTAAASDRSTPWFHLIARRPLDPV